MHPVIDAAPQQDRALAVSGQVQAKTDVEEAKTQKVIVAVHGVGDQYENATIQAVVNQFCGFYRHPAGIPLGNFRTDRSAFSPQNPYPQEPFQRFAFAEVYWAKFPRALVNDKHSLEEAQKWARTIVERLRLRWKYDGKENKSCREADFRLLDQVLSEMIQTVGVLDRLCYVADKAGVFRFDLKRLMEDYLGDVQIVAEFATERTKILQTFSSVMERVHDEYPNADIHIVAHSEGTVVAFLGLLAGFRDASRPAWTERVRGLMMLGSPIDKHLMLWPELFGETPPAHAPSQPIEWRNYYDYGDPIGFSLDDARDWITRNAWERVFHFSNEPGHDNGFTRYPFAGKAHVDYWNDDAVFGHFIQTVLKEKPAAATSKTVRDFSKPPANIRLNQILSYLVPYTAVIALLFTASYVLLKTVNAALTPEGGPGVDNLSLAKGVAGFGTLLLGFTLVARVPRLTRDKLHRFAAIVLAALSVWAYAWSRAGGPSREVFGAQVPAGTLTIIGTIVAFMVVYFVTSARPTWGLKPMIFVGTAAVAVRLFFTVNGAPGAIWPVLIALIGFLYLWWLAALLFDLVYVWHLYIRHSRAINRMAEITSRPGTRR